jgi:hypothetical protein
VACDDGALTHLLQGPAEAAVVAKEATEVETGPTARLGPGKGGLCVPSGKRLVNGNGDLTNNTEIYNWCFI